MNEYDIAKAFETIEKELMLSMLRNMERHKAEETKEGIEWSQWQAEQLKALEQYKIRNREKYGTQFKDINKEIAAIISAARTSGGMEQEMEILRAIKRGFTRCKKTKDAMTAQFFRMNDRKIEALIRATVHDMEKAETAILRMANDKYRQIIFNAQVYANTGAGTYEKAVDMAAKDMLSSGLGCVEYANGARHTLKEYADMAIRTASKRAYLTGEGEKRKEWGISTVIINKRGNPCPLCLPWVGKVMIDDVWSGGKKSDGPYPLMSTAVSSGLYHPRCRDSHTTYFEGISPPPDNKFTKKEIQDIEQENKKEAQQQYARRQAEKYERLAENSLDKENQKRYVARKNEWKQKTRKSIEDEKIRAVVEKSAPLNDKSVEKSSGLSIIKETREMANGLRTSPMRILNADEIIAILKDAEEIGLPIDILKFNEGNQTGFSDRYQVIYIRGDILPDISSMNLRDNLSQKSVLAHEYYGHYKAHPSKFRIGDWRDEFRASYRAAVDAPGLDDEERRMLMLDAYDRAKEAGVTVRYNKTARRIIYGYDD